jgi:hypothetical protein
LNTYESLTHSLNKDSSRPAVQGLGKFPTSRPSKSSKKRLVEKNIKRSQNPSNSTTINCRNISICLVTSVITLGSGLIGARPTSAQTYGMCGTGSGSVSGEAEFSEITLNGTQENKLPVTTEVSTEVEVEVEVEVETAVVGG